MTTDFSKKTEILGEFYFIYKDDEELKEFMEFNDIGLPLAYLASENLCELSLEGKPYVIETWNLLMLSLDMEDTGFDNLNEILEKRGLSQ